MKKTIIAVCQWIIAKLSEVEKQDKSKKSNIMDSLIRRVPSRNRKERKKETSPRRQMHRGIWVRCRTVTTYFPTQRQAAEYIQRVCDVEVRRYDIYNTVQRKGKGVIKRGGVVIAELSYTSDFGDAQ